LFKESRYSLRLAAYSILIATLFCFYFRPGDCDTPPQNPVSQGTTMTNLGPDHTNYQTIIDNYQRQPNAYSELYRPRFHWTPVVGWMNDPNGLVYFDGQWRQFAQHCLPGETDKRWAYATSRDLVHWTQHPSALRPDDLGEMASGSAVVDWHDTSGFFHGKPGIVCIYTYWNHHNGDGRQFQGIAYSPDGVVFTKYAGNPVIPKLRDIPGQEDDVDFRDPKVFWYQPTQRWIMVTGGGFIRIWSSPDLKNWTNECVDKSIQTECPDLFSMYPDGDKSKPPVWILSKAGRGYLLGTFDGHRFAPTSSEQPFNYGSDFYASQTYSDAPHDRCIMSSWLWNFADSEPSGLATTGGMLSVPVELNLVTTADGLQIEQTPVAELKKLREKPFVVENQDLNGTQAIHQSPSDNQCEIVADIDTGSAANVGLSVLGDASGNETIVGYDTVKKEVYIDRSKTGPAFTYRGGTYFSAPLELTGNRLKLDIFVDHAVIEVFAGNGQRYLTSRCYPPAGADTTKAFATGGDAKIVSLKLYPMNSIWQKAK
jgi:fructan beta-fructosidase